MEFYDLIVAALILLFFILYGKIFQGMKDLYQKIPEETQDFSICDFGY